MNNEEFISKTNVNFTNHELANTPNNNAGLSVIVPVYNEKKIIEETIEQLQEVIKKMGNVAELIVVDDGSTDGTSDILESLTNIKIMRHEQNRGYGAALKTGILASKKPWIAITDADGTYPNERIPELWSHAKTKMADMVVGSRVGANAKIPAIRKPAKWFITRLAVILSGSKIPDLNSGLRVFRRESAEDFLVILPDGFSFTTTITLALLTNNRKVLYQPINYHVRHGKSKIKPIRDTLQFIQLIIRMILFFNPLRIFLPISVLLISISFFILFLRAILGSMFLAFSLILFMGGIQLLAIGMIADLIDKRILLSNRSNRSGQVSNK